MVRFNKVKGVVVIKDMTVEDAVKIVTEVAIARTRWGKYAYPAYTQAHLMDALALLHKEGRFGAPSDEEITKLRRQLAACQNREKGRAGKPEDA